MNCRRILYHWRFASGVIVLRLRSVSESTTSELRKPPPDYPVPHLPSRDDGTIASLVLFRMVSLDHPGWCPSIIHVTARGIARQKAVIDYVTWDNQLVLDALRRFLESHPAEMMEQFVREDIEWGLHGKD